MYMLVESYRYADINSLQHQLLNLPHQSQEKMGKLKLRTPGDVSSFQACFFLADLEAGIQRDDRRVFVGMAFRLLLDVGLHVDPMELGLK